jgi:hypothetical protein
MTQNQRKSFKRLALILIAVLAALVVALIVGMHFATRELKKQIESALGPESEVADIIVHGSSIEVDGVRIHAPQGWPAADTLRAQRIIITPDLFGLLTHSIRVNSIRIEQAYVSVLRTKSGHVRLLPSMMEASRKKTDNAPAKPDLSVVINNIELHDGVLDFFDATVRQPAHRVRLEKLEATVGDLHAPELTGHTRIQLDGVVKGVHHDGKLSIDGWVELADKNSEINSTLHGVDLVAFEPYLIKASETGVRRGTLDMTLKSRVRKNMLHAPGMVTLTGLELSSRGSTFMGMPRQAVVAALKNRDGKITLQFTLEGNLDDPKFSLNESFVKTLGTSVANLLGISFEGLTRSLGNATEGVGNAVKRLFGK